MTASFEREATASGRRRRLRRLAGPDGLILGLAIDHRATFQVALRNSGLGGLEPSMAGRLKQVLIRVLCTSASAVMVDAEIGLPVLLDGSVPPGVGIVMPLEAQGYEQQGDDRTTELMTNFSPRTALAFGADSCKLLVPIRVDRPAQVEIQLAVVGEAIAQCHAIGMPIVVEPVVFRLEGEDETTYADGYTDLVIQATSQVAALDPDLLKLPFPWLAGRNGLDDRSAAAACQRLADVVGPRPWVLLGAGTSIATFLWQLEHAGRASASGFLVGRSIWSDVLAADPGRSEALARSLALPRFMDCVATARRSCRPMASDGP
jgi:sulfofructosephosphate aldolase